MMSENKKILTKGLHLDNSPQNQPKDTYRFALNSLIEGDDGDFGFISNEESNTVCTSITSGYTPIGKCYIGDGETVIFSAKDDETASEIGILDNDCNYTVHVNDLGLTEQLNFKITHQVDCTYRLRKGCEKTIYFTDGYSNPRTYIFDRPEKFQDSSGDWDIDKFKLFKTYQQVPNFDSIQVEENGALSSGSYNFSIQYLDDDLNPTEFITTTDTVIIYNDGVTKPFEEIRGSTNENTTYQNFGETNKSIKLTLSNLDDSYSFYRIAIIAANNGSGIVNQIFYSEEIPVGVTEYVYGGETTLLNGTVEEVQAFNNIIEKADHIEQIQNRLVLGGVKGKDGNYCKLQKFASRIESNIVYKEIELNNINSEDNQRRPNLHNESVGYMPGEIYSFGIVYVFKDGTTSPAYHIPGRNYKSFSNMSSDNISETSVYTDNSSCTGEDYWGVDSQGDLLKDQPVRHHRFPLRSEVEKPLIVETDVYTTSTTRYQIELDVSGAVAGAYTSDVIRFKVSYEYPAAGEVFEWDGEINVFEYEEFLAGGGTNFTVLGPTFYGFPVVTGSIFRGSDISSGVALSSTAPSRGSKEFNYRNYTSEIFGIDFSNIVKPTVEDIGEEVIGYYIVRNKREEEDKTILDNGILTPLLKDTYYNAAGPLVPNLPDNTRIMSDAFNLIHPEHKFNGKEYTYTSELIKEGEFKVISKSEEERTTQDVVPGTSYDSTISARREKDSDGFSLHTVSRDNETEYRRLEEQFAEDSEIEEIFYLDGLNSKSVTNTSSDDIEIFNVSADNKTGIVQLNVDKDPDEVYDTLPYVVMKRELANPYSTFRVLPYYKETNNIELFPTSGPTTMSSEIFNGDSYISPIRYTSSFHYNIRLRKRASKDGVLTSILGTLAIVAGTILAATTAATGIGIAAGLTIAGYGISLLSTGIKKEQIAKVYSEDYEAGLRDCINDDTTEASFDVNQEDDEVQWVSDTITNLWIESSVNMNWRKGSTNGLPDFLNAPDIYDKKDLSKYLLEKLTVLDSENSNGRLYQGYANAELYEVNSDYTRRNEEKIYFGLGLEYDCCSGCNEEFPHRISYSEQSFQEELSDNYKIFLPNNYRDIEGETGPISNLFKMQNNLYIQTKEGLWHLPENFQERVTGDILSFVGSGEFFNLPPRKIVDDDTGNSAGTQHKWSVLKTNYAVYFMSQREGVVYKFNGKSLEPISNRGLYNWFKNNSNSLLADNYYRANQRTYPYLDNPSNPIGEGYISAHDSKKERIILTKKDQDISDSLPASDYEICFGGGDITVFEDFNVTLAAREAAGWKYEGIEDCRMKFSKAKTSFPYAVVDNRSIIFQFDTSTEGYTPAQITDLKALIVGEWKTQFELENPFWTGEIYYLITPTDAESKRWVAGLKFAIDSRPTTNEYLFETDSTTAVDGSLIDKNIVLINFVNNNSNSGTAYNTNTIPMATDPSGPAAPLAQYTTDYADFLVEHDALLVGLGSFKGLLYAAYDETDADKSDNFFQHSMAALIGSNALPPNPFELETARESFENTPNPYIDNYDAMVESQDFMAAGYDDGLWQYGYKMVTNRSFATDITAWELILDIKQFLREDLAVGFISDETFFDYEYEDGDVTVLTDPLNNSWTLSHNLKTQSWVSWHSYLPMFYIDVSNKFYSMIQDNTSIFKHNLKGNYQTYYGTLYPHIIEYVSSSENGQTKVWDDLLLHTESKTYDATLGQFVDERDLTYNKAIFYNSRQCSGLQNLTVKNTQASDSDYLINQVEDVSGDSIMLDRNERNWSLNELRDNRTDYSVPIFNSNLTDLQTDYFIDKILNLNSIDYDKDWTEQEIFRDKYLVIRLIFDTFEDKKLILNYSGGHKGDSFR